jgi:hypothetical protein
MIATPNLTDIDANPVIVYAECNGVVAVDALLVSS